MKLNPLSVIVAILIAAELFFGASSGKGGLGWYIFQNRNELYTDKVFAGLAAVIIIGLLEGLTEFVPVSSTGHMIIAGHMLGFTGPRASGALRRPLVGAVSSSDSGRRWSEVEPLNLRGVLPVAGVLGDTGRSPRERAERVADVVVERGRGAGPIAAAPGAPVAASSALSSLRWARGSRFARYVSAAARILPVGVSATPPAPRG